MTDDSCCLPFDCARTADVAPTCRHKCVDESTLLVVAKDLADTYISTNIRDIEIIVRSEGDAHRTNQSTTSLAYESIDQRARLPVVSIDAAAVGHIQVAIRTKGEATIEGHIACGRHEGIDESCGGAVIA